MLLVHDSTFPPHNNRPLNSTILLFSSANQIRTCRYTANVDSRLAKVEEAIQKILPMASAFEKWSSQHDGIPMFPCVVSCSSKEAHAYHQIYRGSSQPSSSSMRPPPPHRNSHSLSTTTAAASKYHPPRAPYEASSAIEKLGPAQSTTRANKDSSGTDDADSVTHDDGGPEDIDESLGLEKEKWADKFALLTKVSLVSFGLEV